MKKAFLYVVFSFFIAFVACDSSNQEAALPTGISTLNLGEIFDTEAEGVHVFSNTDGTLSYVYDDGGDSGPINVDIDAEGRITRLSWEQQAHSDERMQKIMGQAEKRFGSFLKEKTEGDEETRMYFEDGATAYTLSFIGHTITLTTEMLK